jgi:hypothetical protein
VEATVEEIPMKRSVSVLFSLCLAASPLVGCGGDDSSCPIGSQGCACTSGRACNAGLSCAAEGFCVGNGTADLAGTNNSNDAAQQSGGNKRVFITSTPYQGTFGSAEKGDELCAAAATVAGLGGSWVAWLSENSKDAADRIQSPGPWYLVDQSTLVFANAAQLRTTPSAIIDQDEKGEMVSHTNDVWTGTNTGGLHGGSDCIGWLVSSSSATTGSLFSIDLWTQSSNEVCTKQLRLYCFER